MNLRDFITFLGVTNPDIDINFEDLGLKSIHPQDYCLKISCTTSGEVYWQYCCKGEVICFPNLIEMGYFKKFVSVVNETLNHEKDK